MHTLAGNRDSIPAEFIRDVYSNGDFVHYIEALHDNTVYQGNHSGQWSNADRLLFSINGNPYYMNLYYVDGIRLDDRFNPGSTLYVPNIEHYNFTIDPSGSKICFSRDGKDSDYLMFQGNIGGIGGISPGSNRIIHIFHRAGWEGAYKPELSIPYRPHIRHAFSLETYISNTLKNGVKYDHHVSTEYGSRALPKYDADGIMDQSPIYNSPYYKIQLDGKWHINGKYLWEAGYYANISGKKDYNSELYYNWEEVARLFTFSSTIFAKKHGLKYDLNTSLTYSLNNVKHNNINFGRNIVDQDGESFEPWLPDGNTHDFSWFIRYENTLNPHLKLIGESYNTLFYFNPSLNSFHNDIFYKLPDPIESHFPEGTFVPVVNERIPLMHFEWNSNSFTSGLLDNQVGAEYERSFHNNFNLKTSFAASLDGFLLGGSRSKISANIIGQIFALYAPSRHFNFGLKISHDRIRYNYDFIRFFSRDYLNGEAYGAASKRLMLTSGGKYRELKQKLRQTTFASVELPIYINFGKKGNHEIALLQTYRKYFNVWNTFFKGDLFQYGYYDNNVYFYKPGEKKYEIGYLPDGIMGHNFFKRTPFYISQLTRYTFQNSKFFISASWQSMMLGSISALGNGPVTNNVGALSESTANPNTFKVAGNPGPYAAAGRADQDKAYIFRVYTAYNFFKSLQVGINLKWTDGQPFTNYHTFLNHDDEGNAQAAIIPSRSRGINPIDGDFGSRENAIFNIDMHARFQWIYKKHKMSVTLMCYNIFDFGNSINEYCFNDGLNDHRADMVLNIPRGLILKFQVGL